ncbi:MAG: 4-phosphoerythronate dehydrogenase [Balneolaceae bacterium]|nr:MAG: 4-phosphoerythronate dehydrogenase [Balneolaceae bacterium]
MNILADQFLYRIRDFSPDGCKCTLFDPADGFPKYASSFDALLIRTVTKINHETLPFGGNLKFIGTATAGFDHIDRTHLNNLGIAFARSEGCNSNAVGEYVLTSLLKWAESNRQSINKLRIGIVGCGYTGTAVNYYLKKIGFETVLYDPPKAGRIPAFKSAPLEQLLDCNVLTFHTPLTTSGKNKTLHLCGKEWLDNGFKLIINSARGGVVDENALLNAKEHGTVDDFILDVWENEPDFLDEAAKQAFIATPHIAGYSREAKFRASEIVIAKLCKFFGLKRSAVKFDAAPPDVKQPKEKTFASFLWENHQISLYHRGLRELIGLSSELKSSQFATLRSQTETRFEFASILKKSSENIGFPKEAEIFL